MSDNFIEMVGSDKVNPPTAEQVLETSNHISGSNQIHHLQHDRLMQAVYPALLTEMQNTTFSAAIFLSSIAAKYVYFRFALRAASEVTTYIGAALLTSILFHMLIARTKLASVETLLAGGVMIASLFYQLGLSFLLTLCLLFLLKVSEIYSRGWFLIWFATSFLALSAIRFSLLLWARRLQAEGRLARRVAVYGTAVVANRVTPKLNESLAGLSLVGFFTDDADPPRECAGDLQALIRLTRNGGCDRVILAFPGNAEASMRKALRVLELLPVDIQISPDGLSLPYRVQGAHQLGNLVLFNLQNQPLSARGFLTKAAMDYVISTVALFVLAPAMMLIALAIKLDTRGPVFFIQRRNGYNQKVIRVIKFRTMTVAEDGPLVVQAVRGDKRVTRFGRFLRKTSLDELPQLINVLRGDLSLVGPRPHALAHNEMYAQLLIGYDERFKVKPGITGWAQVNGCRGETKTVADMRKRIALDLQYIRNWSPWLDLKIMAKTTLVPFYSSNAF